MTMGKKKGLSAVETYNPPEDELEPIEDEPPADTEPPKERRKRRTKAEIAAANTVDPIALLAQAREALVKEKESLGQEIERLTARLGVIEEALASTRTA
jgi:hypothetical protein